MRDNESIAVLPSEARTATVTGDDQKNWAFNGLHLIIDVTAISATPSVVPKIQGKDPVSGKYYDLLTGVAITAVGITVLKLFPSATAAANVTVNDTLPRTWRVIMTHADADSITYSVGANMVVG